MFPQLTELTIFNELLASKTVARLSDVSFLGALDRLTTRGLITGTRLEHSISVAYLAYLGTLQLENSVERDTAVAAALLHDIGHGPLSHSTETFFNEKFRMNHRIQGKKFFVGDRDVLSTLLTHKVDPFRVENLAFGKKTDRLSYLFHNPINIDTIEGIIRCAKSIGVKEIPESTELVQLLISPDFISQKAGDSFWRLKDKVYNDFILINTSVAYDAVCCLALEREKVEARDFRLTDGPFLDKFRESILLTFDRLISQAENNPAKLNALGSRFRGFSIRDDIQVNSPEDVRLRYR